MHRRCPPHRALPGHAVATVLKAERAAYILQRLQELYPQTPVPLDHSDPFTLLVAVLLSAQCTDERVNQVTPALFALADTPAAMAALDVEQIREIIRPCGLSPQKSRAIKRLSEILVEEHGGEVPADMEALERLPGVGHKTASVVMSQAFGVPAFPVDTHIHRLAQRWGLSSGKNVRQECGADRERPEATVSARVLEQASSADYFLRPPVLHRPRLRRPHLRDLCHLLPTAQAPEENAQGMSFKVSQFLVIASRALCSVRGGRRGLPRSTAAALRASLSRSRA